MNGYLKASRLLFAFSFSTNMTSVGRVPPIEHVPLPACFNFVNRRPVKSPLEKVRSFFFLQKLVLMGLNFIPQKIRVVIGLSCRRFLQ